ncbi:hypothetical protein CA13_61760 [Planctomycetes bacterium CA13]|uniref:Uncharacterized protein n=1 Tax=Novipirellula herctigrandis TaxID=2527986 RepID=A0A5C5ZC29_9BACT|nr:hypothetical protein CA13_61760 [Planctomycetes bacterium CA13]
MDGHVSPLCSGTGDTFLVQALLIHSWQHRTGTRERNAAVRREVTLIRLSASIRNRERNRFLVVQTGKLLW